MFGTRLTSSSTLARPSSSRPRLACPDDRSPIAAVAGGWSCPVCNREFRTDGSGVLDLRPRALDSVNERVREQDDAAYAMEQRLREGQPRFERSMEVAQEDVLLRAHVRLLGALLERSTVLDDGCGRGRLLARVAARVGFASGIDLSREAVGTARSRLLEDGSTVEHLFLAAASGLALPFTEAQFDIVLSCEVLEHVPDPGQYLREIHRVLRPGGHATISTPSGWLSWFPYPGNLLRAALKPRSAALAMFPERRWAQAVVHHPAIRPSVLRRWCRDAGLEPVTHEYTLWHYWSRSRVLYRILALLQHAGVPSHVIGPVVLRSADRVLSNVHWLRFFASRQVLLVRRAHT